MTSLPPPGWYRDPRDPEQPHYWDGQRWAELEPKAPAPQVEPPPPEDEPASANRPPVSRPPADTRKRSRVVVAGLVTLAVIALIAIGAAVQSLSNGGGHKSTPPSRSSVPSTGLVTTSTQ